MDSAARQAGRHSGGGLRPDFAAAGQQAADFLERLMCSKTLRHKADVAIVRGRNEIVTRASMRPESTAGLLVQRALAFIQSNARNSIGIQDVQALLGVSRALIGLRFREVRGESVLTVLTDARLKELKNALKASDEPIGEITARLGWTSPNYPKNLFRKRFGISMSAWRAANRKGLRHAKGPSMPPRRRAGASPDAHRQTRADTTVETEPTAAS